MPTASVIVPSGYANYVIPTQVVPVTYDPYLIDYKDKNSTVFIAVGSILFSLSFLLLLTRVWIYFKNRRAAKARGIVDIEDYYGYNDAESEIGSLFEKSNSGWGNTLAYDSSLFHKSNNSQSSSFFNSSNSSSSSSSNSSPQQQPKDINKKLSDMTNQQGHQLRQYTKRSSYISPINQLLSETQLIPEINVSLDEQINPETPVTHTRGKSISVLMAGGFSPKAKSRHASVDLTSLHKLVNQSLQDVSAQPTRSQTPVQNNPSKELTSNANGSTNNKKINRPPSMLLDMFVEEGSKSTINL
ncbi:hypothetical protein DAMA08_026430 [Martiniozyma asiatica (nom. inval.)]|nr:hypothetical protein DAMA08_026430 [Martiniozyma asiatica]